MNVKIYKYINLDYLEMMSDGDDSMKKVMLEMLLEELPQEVSKMTNLLEQEDWENLASVSHKMKSTLAFVGNDELTNANKQIEEITKSVPSKDTLDELVKILESLYPMVIVELQEELSKL
jgi:HPt (histidine-containing phosphotransfer) domain-containing protein